MFISFLKVAQLVEVVSKRLKEIKINGLNPVRKNY